VYHKVVGGFLEVSCKHLVVSFRDQLDDISYSDINDTKKPLVLLLELLLIEDLHGQDAVLIDLEVETLIPVRVEGLLGDCCRLSLLTVDGGDRERIGEPEDISFV
jgi:hypothetical protein